MNQNKTKKSAEYDTPIPKPMDNFEEEFLKMLRSRFTTKRFPKEYDTQRNRGVPHRPESH